MEKKIGKPVENYFNDGRYKFGFANVSYFWNSEIFYTTVKAIQVGNLFVHKQLWMEHSWPNGKPTQIYSYFTNKWCVTHKSGYNFGGDLQGSLKNVIKFAKRLNEDFDMNLSMEDFVEKYQTEIPILEILHESGLKYS